jgi:hypothetical protein
MYISANETIFYVGPLGHERTFMLSRIKYNFVLYYKSIDGKYGYFNAPSELIDISMTKLEAYDLHSTFADIDKKINVYQYTYKSGLDDELKIRYYGLSISGFVTDFIMILFFEVENLWNADKYEKRLYRMLMFIQLEMSLFDKLAYLDNIIKYVDTNNYDNATNLANYQILVDNLTGTGTIEFIDAYEKRVRSRIINKQISSVFDVGKYSEMLKIVIDVLTEFKNNCCAKLSLNTSGTDGAVVITHLGGGFEKKYKKYSQKYDELLKILNMKI